MSPGPTDAPTIGAQRTGRFPGPPMVTDLWFPFRRRCAGRFPFPVCRPYGFLSHYTLLLWLQGSQGRSWRSLIGWIPQGEGA